MLCGILPAKRVFMISENILLLAAILAAAIFDYRFRKVPNLITFPLILIGMVIGLLQGGFMAFSASTAGFLLGIALLSFPYAMGGIGAGDVKLLGAIGAVKGPWFVFATFLAAAIIGGIMAVCRMAFLIKNSDMRVLGQSVRAAYYTGVLSTVEIPDYALKERLPYAVAISAGAVITMILEMR